MDEEIFTIDDAIRHVKLAILHAHEYITDIQPKDSEVKYVQEEVLLALEESTLLLEAMHGNIFMEENNLNV